jgi:hypothetical protein
VVTISLTVLGRLNRVGQLAAMRQGAQQLSRSHAPSASQRRQWTPTPLPEPLNTRSTLEVEVLPTHDELVAKARIAAVAKRPEAFEGEGLAIVSPFAKMGHIDSPAQQRPDLDEVLRRRRAV